MIRPLFFLLALIAVFLLTAPSQSAQEFGTDRKLANSPASTVILVIDGLGSSYVYPEMEARTVEGGPAGYAALPNLTSGGARVLDIRAPVPSTGVAHSVLVTGFSGASEQTVGIPGATIFDMVRERGYLCIAILQRGDFSQMLLEQDAFISFDDNSIRSTDPLTGGAAGVLDEVRRLLEICRERFAVNPYDAPGTASYKSYNQWALDAAAWVVTAMKPEQRFLLFVNVGAVDSAGHNLGLDVYLDTVQSLDAPLGKLAAACRQKEALLVVTSDHGMAFSGGRGGHASPKYSAMNESRRVACVFMGPNVADMNLAGVWSQADIAPTVLGMIGIHKGLALANGRPMPLREKYLLSVVLSKPQEVVITHGGRRVAEGFGSNYSILLPLGLYEVLASGSSRRVLLDEDLVVDLQRIANVPSRHWTVPKAAIGWFLIAAINIVGVLLIRRIVKANRPS